MFARKYRPMLFEDVVAQEHVTTTLQNAIRNERVASGYLFCGPRGTGKTTTARILAKALNCSEGPTPTPCGKCSSCTEITSGSSLDVLEIDAASNTGVDDIRSLRENVRYLPASGQKRIYIIDEIHRLSAAAFDALLKTLEEPPPHVIFIFATTEPTKVPETILSRTQRFDFKRVSAIDLARHLGNIAEKEKMVVEAGALKTVARKADGSVRDALSLLDQIAAYAGEKITEADVIAALGLVDSQLLFDFTAAIAARDSKAALGLIDTAFQAGVDVNDFVGELMEHFRLLMVLKADPELASPLGLTGDDMARLTEQAGYFQIGDIIRLMKMGADLNYDLKSGLDHRLVLEVAAVKMAEMEATVRLQEILTALKDPTGTNGRGDLFGQSEKKKDDRPVAIRSDQSDTPTPETTPEIAGTSPRTLNLPIIKAGWEAFLTILRGKSQMLASLLSMGKVRGFENNMIKAAFGTAEATSVQVIEKKENYKTITDCLREHFRANVGISFDVDESIRSPQRSNQNGAMSRDQVEDLVEKSPRLKKLMEKVNGEVIGMRKIK